MLSFFTLKKKKSYLIRLTLSVSHMGHYFKIRPDPLLILAPDAGLGLMSYSVN